MVTDLSRQQLEIYLLLKENFRTETEVSELTQADGLNIASYTERISELRKKGYKVVNVRKNFYLLVGEPPVTLAELRFIFREAKKRGYTNLMKRCVEKANQLKIEEVKRSLF